MRRLAVPTLAFLLAACGLAASATTYVPIPDGQLADQAELIVAGTVEERRTIGAEAEALATEYAVRVDGVAKGRAWGGIAVRVPGGERADGTAVQVWGAPRFRVGERVLLFLARQGDGSYGTLHLTLGAFHEVAAAGRRWAVRDLAEAVPAGAGVPAEPGRDLARFSRWLADRAAGLRRAPDYLVALPAAARAALGERFTYAGNRRKRWHEFDRLESVGWRAAEGGLAGFPGGGFAELVRAMAAWNGDRATNIRYRYDGKTAEAEWRQGNRVDFDDADRVVTGRFTCTAPGVGAGVLATAKIIYSFQGGEPYPIVRTRVVLNDGAGCWFTSGARLEEVLGHELGHTLGLGHSCGDGTSGPCAGALTDEALMRAHAHGDDRGARLNADDRAGILSLYPMRFRALPVPGRP